MGVAVFADCASTDVISKACSARRDQGQKPNHTDGPENDGIGATHPWHNNDKGR